MPWFKSWFDSPYYHILYHKRDEAEAEIFLDNLLEFLKPKNGSFMLDLGCGKGRHSVYLNEKGYNVTGIDLSEQSIQHCLQFENSTLSFYVHDMRKLFRVNDFDFVLNLFTSFGYFEKDTENFNALKNACLALKKGGSLVIDFFNSDYVKKHLIAENTIVAGGIKFTIRKKFENGFIFKDIYFTDKGKDFHFTEKVAALTTADFKRYLAPLNINIKYLFGDYDLHEFDALNSPRCIIVAVK